MSKYKIGSIIKATVSGITPYGFFVATDDGYAGLCHISEVSNDFVDDIANFVHENETIYAQVLEVDNVQKQLKLSVKDIYYKTEEEKDRIVESRKGFLPLKKMLSTWIENKMKEYQSDK